MATAAIEGAASPLHQQDDFITHTPKSGSLACYPGPMAHSAHSERHRTSKSRRGGHSKVCALSLRCCRLASLAQGSPNDSF
eukprot:329682-Amphidinium_carterae.1